MQRRGNHRDKPDGVKSSRDLIVWMIDSEVLIDNRGAAFEDLVAALRATEEWKFVDREIDLRLVRGEG